MNKDKTGMWFFLGSESFFFLALLIAYAYYSHPGGSLSATANYLEFNKSAIYSVFLFASSATIACAAWMRRRGRRHGFLACMAATILLGIVFLLGQGTEYVRLIRMDITISRDVFGSAFFTLTGFHGLHVLGGLILLMIGTGIVASGRFRNMEGTFFESASMYWHFVDVVWIFVFSVVYVGAVI